MRPIHSYYIDSFDEIVDKWKQQTWHMYGNIFTQCLKTLDDLLQVTTGNVSLGKEVMIFLIEYYTGYQVLIQTQHKKRLELK